MELKKKLFQLRKEQGLTQLELAEALNVSRQAVSRWEVGTAIPSLENLVGLSKTFQVPLDYLVHDEMEKPGSKEPEAVGSEGRQRVHRIIYLLPIALILAVVAIALLFHPYTHTTKRSEVTDIVNAVKTGLYPPMRASVQRAAKVSSFTEQVKGYYGVSGFGEATPILSPLLKLRLDYNKWKETRPPLEDLPNSQGPTEENMAYLRNRYTGELTMFYKMEALDIMLNMGIITREQNNFFYGTEEKTWTAGTAEIHDGPLEEGVGHSSMAYLEQKLYRLSPLAKSLTLDDLFSYLEEYNNQ